MLGDAVSCPRGGCYQASLACGSSVGAREPRRRACAPRPARFFLKVMPCRAKKRDSALRLAKIRRLRRTETSSFSVRSRCSRITARICCEYFSNGDVPPPRGIGSHVPSSRKRCTQRIAELALTSKCSAASRREAPASTNSITRVLKSPGYGPRIGHPANQCARLAPPADFGNPDSLGLGHAVVGH